MVLELWDFPGKKVGHSTVVVLVLYEVRGMSHGLGIVGFSWKEGRP